MSQPVISSLYVLIGIVVDRCLSVPVPGNGVMGISYAHTVERLSSIGIVRSEITLSKAIADADHLG